MNARDRHVAGQPPAWLRLAHSFRRFDGTWADRYMTEEETEDDRRIVDWRRGRPADMPPRVTTPEPRRVASLDAWRTSPAVRKERRRGIVIGFVLAMAAYGLGSLVLVLAFHALGVRP